MESKIRRSLNWIKYSGASVVLTVNPLHWRWVPYARVERNIEWPSPNEHMVVTGWLFVTVRAWIDDGSW